MSRYGKGFSADSIPASASVKQGSIPSLKKYFKFSNRPILINKTDHAWINKFVRRKYFSKLRRSFCSLQTLQKKRGKKWGEKESRENIYMSSKWYKTKSSNFFSTKISDFVKFDMLITLKVISNSFELFYCH